MALWTTLGPSAQCNISRMTRIQLLLWIGAQYTDDVGGSQSNCRLDYCTSTKLLTESTRMVSLHTIRLEHVMCCVPARMRG